MKRKTVKLKVISSDLDGTLIDHSFADSVWLEGIPQLYSVRRGFTLDQAKKTVKKEYDKVGPERPEWYDLQFWIRKFDLNVEPQDLLRRFEYKIRTYPEVPKVLEELTQRGYELIIVTNARREFADLELRILNLNNYFKHLFSSTSDFGLVKKTVEVYKKVCDELKISPQEIIHVGDDQHFDYDVPRQLGITAIYLNRDGKCYGDFIIHSLEDLSKKLEQFG